MLVKSSVNRDIDLRAGKKAVSELRYTFSPARSKNITRYTHTLLLRSLFLRQSIAPSYSYTDEKQGNLKTNGPLVSSNASNRILVDRGTVYRGGRMKTMLERTAIRILSQGSHSLTLEELISPASSSSSPYSVKKKGGRGGRYSFCRESHAYEINPINRWTPSRVDAKRSRQINVDTFMSGTMCDNFPFIFANACWILGFFPSRDE